MREISNHFCLIRPEYLMEYILPGECIYLPHGAVDIICNHRITLDQEKVDDEDGPRWQISFSAGTKDERVKAFDGEHVYIGVQLTDGTIHILGTADFAPVLHVTPYERAYAVSASLEMLSPLDL